MEAANNCLIDGLRDPSIYPSPCSRVELIETHISWVLLTGLRAYKIKKPVDLGFVDFTTLERRRHYCDEELRLNRRLAPELYLDVVPITGSVACPQIGGDGPVIDYAVCMLQFDQHQLLNTLPPGDLLASHIDDLADCCAAFHGDAAREQPDGVFGTPEQIMKPVRENFDVLRCADGSICHAVRVLEEHAEFQLNRLRQTFDNRRRNGMIRECHGDLHLGNMFLHDDRVTVFDGIEFNDDFRWIDIMNDIAFVVMDLEDRGYHSHSRRLLNRWLERTGDYSGLKVLPFYCSYRAVIRAKVDAMQMHQPRLSFSDQRHLANDCRGYLQLAQRYTLRQHPALMITMGPSGSGKTTVTQRLIESTDAIRVRSDVERKRLHGLPPEAASDPKLKERIYSEDANAATYDRLGRLAVQVIDAGFPVVVDATFLKRHEREKFSRLADRLGVPFLIIKCDAGEETLKQRIRQRKHQCVDASEADERVLQLQLATREHPDPSEAESIIDGADEALSNVVRHRLIPRTHTQS